MYISGAGLPKLLGRYKNPVGIEIGLSAGHTTKHLFENVEGLTLHGVDPYFDYVDWNGNVLSPDKQGNTYADFVQNTEPFRDRIVHHRMISDDVAGILDNNSFDFIFIDGLHTYEQVLKDCQNFYSKIKDGGLFAGHDYNVIEGVNRAVNEFAASVGAAILQTDNDVWYWFKPKKVPIVVCSVNGKCVPVLKASVERYAPEAKLIVFEGEATTFGQAYNAALEKVFKEYDEVIVANDDIVLTPWSYKYLLEDVEQMRGAYDQKVGFVAAHSDSAAHRQNVRYQNGEHNTLSPYYNKWDWELTARESEIVAPLFAWMHKAAFDEAQFPPLNWYSDDVICLDLGKKGFKHFISKSYIHHVGSQTVGQNFATLNGEAVGWLRANRPDYAERWFGPEHPPVPVPKKKPKICVYAISKNEEQFVQRFCESAQDADLILIADTGSTDGTTAIGRSCGAEVHDICITPWRFDHARDAALALVPKDYDICISLDLDEVLELGWREEVERVWESGTTRLRYMYDWGGGLQFLYEKIHARHGYHWHHPCHEYPRPDGRIVEVWAQTNKLLVSHHADPHKSRGQYLELLELSVKEDPHCTRNAFYYARELHFYGRQDESIEACKKYLAMPNALWHHERCYAMRILGACYEAKNEPKEAEGWYWRAAAEAPTTREPWVALAKMYYHQARWAECYTAALRALSITDREYVYTCDPACWSAVPHDFASIGAWNIGLKTEAVKHVKNAITFVPDDGRLQNNLKIMEEDVSPTKEAKNVA
jgi:glycosyltransferase involved in cell wall biosynthesis